MISSNALSRFILHHYLNRFCDNNLCSIQYLVRTSEPAREKFKHVCEDFPNLSIIAKSATPGDVQLMFAHTSVGNKFLRESGTAFSLAELLGALIVVSIDVDIAFAISGDRIHIPFTEVLLCAAIADLSG